MAMAAWGKSWNKGLGVCTLISFQPVWGTWSAFCSGAHAWQHNFVCGNNDCRVAGPRHRCAHMFQRLLHRAKIADAVIHQGNHKALVICHR